MKIGKLKKDGRFESRTDKTLGIQTFGEKNDYPQQVMEIVGASVTGSSSVDVFSKFISGQGFNDPAFFNLEVNSRGETNDVLLQLAASDFAMFNGFALHVNYNANGRITQISHAPFETVRLGVLNDKGVCETVAIHWDWGRRMTHLRKWSKEDIVLIDLFNPDVRVIEAQAKKAGGWGLYKGQVLYFSGNRANNYPLPKYDAALTDMSAEEGIANISYRNAREGFLLSGMFIDILDWQNPENQKQIEENEKALHDFQGDEKTGSIAYSCVNSKDDIPTFIPFGGKNYDKEYTVTREKVKNDIGRSFNQPPILRAEDVGGNFGADAIRHAYNYYNSVTEVERLQVERVFARLFKYWHGAQFNDFSIVPLSYKTSTPGVSEIPSEISGVLTANEKRALIGFDKLKNPDDSKPILATKIGVGGVQAVCDIIADPNMPDEQKRGALKLLFGLSDEDVDSVIPKSNG
jgi:hypothetical protein